MDCHYIKVTEGTFKQDKETILRNLKRQATDEECNNTIVTDICCNDSSCWEGKVAWLTGEYVSLKSFYPDDPEGHVIIPLNRIQYVCLMRSIETCIDEWESKVW